MKKITAFILAMMLWFALAACGADPVPVPPPEEREPHTSGSLLTVEDGAWWAHYIAPLVEEFKEGYPCPTELMSREKELFLIKTVAELRGLAVPVLDDGGAVFQIPAEELKAVAEELWGTGDLTRYNIAHGTDENGHYCYQSCCVEKVEEGSCGNDRFSVTSVEEASEGGCRIGVELDGRDYIYTFEKNETCGYHLLSVEKVRGNPLPPPLITGTVPYALYPESESVHPAFAASEPFADRDGKIYSYRASREMGIAEIYIFDAEDLSAPPLSAFLLFLNAGDFLLSASLTLEGDILLNNDKSLWVVSAETGELLREIRGRQGECVGRFPDESLSYLVENMVEDGIYLRDLKTGKVTRLTDSVVHKNVFDTKPLLFYPNDEGHPILFYWGKNGKNTETRAYDPVTGKDVTEQYGFCKAGSSAPCWCRYGTKAVGRGLQFSPDLLEIYDLENATQHSVSFPANTLDCVFLVGGQGVILHYPESQETSVCQFYPVDLETGKVGACCLSTDSVEECYPLDSLVVLKLSSAESGQSVLVADLRKN